MTKYIYSLNYTIFLTIVITCTPFSANSALIDNNLYTTDTVSGLDWLDLTETIGKSSYTNAELLNPGWRYATNLEVEDLFLTSFSGYYDTNTTLHESDSRDGAYSNQDTDVEKFKSLFGFLKDYSSSHDNEISHGFYEDEDGILRIMGTFSRVTDIFGEGIYSKILSVEYTTNFDGFRDSVSQAGIYLVRDTAVVPAPASVWLFSAGIISLFSLSRRATTAIKRT